MNRFVRRVSVAVASAAIAGGAILGAGGSASAATSSPIDHNRSSIVNPVNDGGRDGYQAVRYGHDGGRNDGWDGYRSWYTHDGHRDHHHGWHHQSHYRWDGHRLYVWDDGRWVDVTPFHNGSIDFWYVDQLLQDQR
ncbi:hypothetical protein OG963_01015 [Streptomyces sp. NBC_01707]|uniref:hypothetical protein n=1 Tax=Streptomyces sp. NBC_01707 TaxID=2975914 RepID=UPI00352D624C